MDSCILTTLDAFIARTVRVNVLACIGSGSNLQVLDTVGYICTYLTMLLRESPNDQGYFN